jgi:triacylglycerol lipase
MKSAPLLRAVLLVATVSGGAAAAVLLPDNAPRVLIFILAASTPMLVHAILLGIEFAVGAAADPRSPRTSFLHVVCVWWGELCASVATMHWRIPFRTRALPAATSDPSKPAVLLIHGYLCNHAVWQPMIDAGVFDGCTIAAVDLEPVFSDIDNYADAVHASVESLLSIAASNGVILVCHSMGGLAARSYLRRHGDARILRVIMIGSPHRGTIFGRLGIGANARQMACGSEFLARLAAGETPALRSKFICIASRDDNLVIPRSSVLLEGAAARHVDGIGHLRTIESAPVWQIVREEISAASALR